MVKNSLVILVLLVTGISLSAQRGGNDTLKSDDVFIIKEYQPKISDAFKLSDQPKIVDTIIKVDPNASYNVREKMAETNFETKPIKPAIMKGEPLNKLYRAYVLAGIGSYLTSRAEVVINSTRSKKWDYGLHLWHHASQGNVKDLGESAFADNNFNIYGRKFFFNKILSADLKYDINGLHRYGFNPSSYPTVITTDQLSKDKTFQRYQNVEPTLRLKSYYKDSNKINSDIKFVFSNYTDNYQSVENRTKFNLDLDRYFGEEFVSLKLKFDYNQYNSLEQAKNVILADENMIIGMKPGIKTGGKDWLIKAAFSLDYSSGANSKSYFFPDIYGKYNLVDELLVPYAGVNGGLERNNYKNLTRENPFMLSQVSINNKVVKYNVYGGIRGNYSATTSFNLQVAYREVENFGMFINQSNQIPGSLSLVSNQFDVIYDDATVTQLTAEVGYQRIDKLNLLLRGDYFLYSITNQPEAWNMPNFKLNLNANYDISDKIVLTADIFIISERMSQVYNPVLNTSFTESLDAFVDVNLGLEYFLTKRWSAFLRLNNLANSNYQYWSQYQVQGLTLLGGMTYSFWGNKRKKK